MDRPSTLTGAAGAPDARAHRGPRWLQRLASLRLTAVALLVLFAAAVPAILTGEAVAWQIAVPLGVLELNLLAAIATNNSFRRQFALLGFHVALALMVALVAVGRLTHLIGYAEVAEGMAFEGLHERRGGPWHGDLPDSLAFANERVLISYHPGPMRDETRNQLRYVAGDGRVRTAEIGDHRPLVLGGYRIYATFNKGFAPVLTWLPDQGGEPVTGVVNLPRYPGEKAAQWREWEIPGAGLQVLTALLIDEVVLDPQRTSILRPPRLNRLVVRLGDSRHELRVGEQVALPGGTLRYQELRMWMGYQISYDWTTPWVLASALLAVGFLALHFWRRYANHAWLRDDVQPAAEATLKADRHE